LQQYWGGWRDAPQPPCFRKNLQFALADVEEWADTAEKSPQQPAFEYSRHPPTVAARVGFPSEPYLDTCFSRLEHSLPICRYLPALDPKHVRAHSAQSAPKSPLESQPPKRV